MFKLGTKCISAEYMSQLGTAINDCHAEILAIRILRKYFYVQLHAFCDWLLDQSVEQQNSTIFELSRVDTSSDSAIPPIKLKPDIKFHLYISSSPCGDGRIFARQDNMFDLEKTNE